LGVADVACQIKLGVITAKDQKQSVEKLAANRIIKYDG
jgi:hypothetical protein